MNFHECGRYGHYSMNDKLLYIWGNGQSADQNLYNYLLIRGDMHPRSLSTSLIFHRTCQYHSRHPHICSYIPSIMLSCRTSQYPPYISHISRMNLYISPFILINSHISLFFFAHSYIFQIPYLIVSYNPSKRNVSCLYLKTNQPIESRSWIKWK